jgi:hypothetical protein
MKEEPEVGFLQYIISHVSSSRYAKHVSMDWAGRRLVQCLKFLLIHPGLALNVPSAISLSTR